MNTVTPNERATQDLTAENPHPSSNGQPGFANFDEDWRQDKDGNKFCVRKPRHITIISGYLRELVRNWPKRVEEELFVQTPDHQPVYLKRATRLFGWIDIFALVRWAQGCSFVTKEEFFEYLRITAEQFDAIETLPHWPPIDGIYYMHQPISGEVGKLDEFINYFSPATQIDRALIKAMILTLFWGGPPGKRPAFLVTGPDKDDEQGRGVGKSTLCHIISDELVDGRISVSPTNDIDQVKKRLLSTESGRRRVAMLDNVKSLRFSWADLEGLITETVISGYKLYVGEGRRPNVLVWMITLNGATFSKDMAQRSIQIKLNRPKFSDGWEDEARQFARDHRNAILSDVQSILESTPSKMSKTSRWGLWERDIISKLDDSLKIWEEIKARQEAMDDDSSDRALIIACIRRKLEEHQHDPDVDAVLIPSATLAEWVSDVTRTHYATNAASAFVKTLQIPELRAKHMEDGAKWVWTGPKCKWPSIPTPLVIDGATPRPG